MTIEEAINKLKQYLDNDLIEDISGNEGVKEAIDTAIKVFEQPEAPIVTVALELTEEEYQRLWQQMKTVPIVVTPPEIIRCEECRHYRTADIFGKRLTMCKRGYDSIYVEPDDFCSYAERKEQDDG